MHSGILPLAFMAQAVYLYSCTIIPAMPVADRTYDGMA